MRYAVLIALAALGCGGRARVPVHPVEGRVRIDGRPAAFARVAFHPQGEGRLAVAVAGPDGAFRLTTFAAEDGAAAGQYAVTVLWYGDTGEVDECADPVACDKLGGRYADPEKTRLRATVGPGKNEVVLKVATAGSWSLPRLRDRDR